MGINWSNPRIVPEEARTFVNGRPTAWNLGHPYQSCTKTWGLTASRPGDWDVSMRTKVCEASFGPASPLPCFVPSLTLQSVLSRYDP